MTPAFLLDPTAITSCPVKVQNAVLYGGEEAADPERQRRIDATLAAMEAGAAFIVDAELPPSGPLKGKADLLVRGNDTPAGLPGYYPGLTRDYSALVHVPNNAEQDLVSFPHEYTDNVTLPYYQFRWDRCEADTLQLAHLWTLLEACGHAAGVGVGAGVALGTDVGLGPAVGLGAGASAGSVATREARPSRGRKDAWGIIIGTDEVEGWSDGTLVWINLNDHQIRTYTTSSVGSWRRRSPLNRFAHESKFRVRVAQTAHARLLADSDDEQAPPLAVAPVRIRECETCQWWDRCEPELDDDISVKIKRAPLDTKEITVLRSLGVRTVTDLAETDIEALLPHYLPRVAHRGNTEHRLRLAARRSRLLAEGIRLERLTTGPIALPSADIEIDFDIESSAQDRVYLWGFLVHDRRPGGGEPQYHPVSDFTKLTAQGEIALANSAGTFLRDLLVDLGWSESDTTPKRPHIRSSTRSNSPTTASASDATFSGQGPTVRLWHYSSYETTTIARLASSQTRDTSGIAWLHRVARPLFVDLFPLVKGNFFGVNGLGLKKIATDGAGFSWRDPDPSGLNSQHWFVDAVQAPTEVERDQAKARILEYNEDDVRATWALRQWLRSLT